MFSFNIGTEIKDILIIAPHSDDEILTCGGLIHRLKHGKNKDSINVNVAILNFGDACLNINPARVFVNMCEAAEIIGIDSVVLSGTDTFERISINEMANNTPRTDKIIRFKDNYMEPNGEMIRILTEIVRKTNADLVITTDPNDFHTDHRNVARASIEACYQAGREYVFSYNKYDKKPILLFGSVDVEFNSPFKADIIFELSPEDVMAKEKALLKYTGFKELFKNNDVLGNWVHYSTRSFGAQIGCTFGEGFRFGNLYPLKIKT